VVVEPLFCPLGVLGVETVSGMAEKLAITLRRVVMVTVRGFVVPEASPDQPEKL